MNRILIGVAVVIFLTLGLGYFVFSKTNKVPSAPSVSPQETSSAKSATFGVEKKSAHYESNTPEHGATLAGVPVNVVINFNFDLAPSSQIKIEKEGKDYGQEETLIDENKLAMRRQMDSTAPDGVYTVNYNACWPDKSCHDGNFQFAIDRSKVATFEDQTGNKEVAIKMSEIMFAPQNIKIAKGTKVTWINDDSVEHYVNTESHPAHTYYPSQNSKALRNGDSYSLVFNTAGFYPYHCSAHAETMTGAILVE